MREQVIQTVESYIDAVRRHDVAALPLHSGIVFEGPLNTVRGIPEFEEGLIPFYAILKSIAVLHLTADDTTCAAVLEIDTIFGVIPFLEYFHVADGKIVSIRAYYDPRPILEGRARAS
ncbi:MAG: nuclear transport factor 2 family protein [Terracidiphilus sp.]|nr:nuclear transport factor 2 family protein [Terracidiphilus sp.]